MSYSYFIAGTKLPIPPSKFRISIPSKNETVTLINDGDINILKEKGLKEFDCEVYLPFVKYPFASYTSGFENIYNVKSDIIPAIQYLSLFQTLKDDKLPFQLDIYRELPDGTATWNTSETVSLEDYEVIEDAEYGFDVCVSLNFKQYKHYATQNVVLSEDGLTYTTIRDSNKKVNRIVQARAGDTLPILIQREFGYTTPELLIKIGQLNKTILQNYNCNRGGFVTDLHEGMPIRLTEV